MRQPAVLHWQEPHEKYSSNIQSLQWSQITSYSAIRILASLLKPNGLRQYFAYVSMDDISGNCNQVKCKNYSLNIRMEFQMDCDSQTRFIDMETVGYQPTYIWHANSWLQISPCRQDGSTKYSRLGFGNYMMKKFILVARKTNSRGDGSQFFFLFCKHGIEQLSEK